MLVRSEACLLFAQSTTAWTSFLVPTNITGSIMPASSGSGPGHFMPGPELLNNKGASSKFCVSHQTCKSLSHKHISHYGTSETLEKYNQKSELNKNTNDSFPTINQLAK